MSVRQRPSTATATATATAGDQSTAPTPPQQKSSLSQVLESTANLANLLPTGTLLAFQLLTPIFTNNGSCDAATRPLTLLLLAALAASCFFASFTDSIRASDGQVYYGLATPRGLWLFDRPRAGRVPVDLSKYRVSFIDVVHAVVSVLVFAAVAMRDKNVVRCLYPMAGKEAEEVLDIVPIAVGVVSSLLFMAFPTRRHGIGYPLTRGDT